MLMRTNPGLSHDVLNSVSRDDAERERKARLMRSVRSGEGALWVALISERRCESRVFDSLETLNVDALLPKFTPLPKKRKGKTVVLPARPFMPGYVFARVVITNRALAGLRLIEHCYGVLCNGDKPVPLDGNKLIEFNDKATSGNVDNWINGGVDTGMDVRVISGPFCGYRGVVHGMFERSCMVQVGPFRPIEFDLDMLEVAD